MIEVTGRLEMTFVYAAHKAGLPVVVCNAGHVRKFAGASGRIAKTDKIDAQCIAHFGEAVRPRQQSANRYDINGWAHLSGSQSDAKVGQFSMQMHTQRSNFLTTQEVRYDHHEFLSRIIGPGKKPTE